MSLALGLHELVPNRLSLRCGDPLYRKQAEERERVLRVSCSSVREMDCLREETVPVSGRSGAQSSVASTRR